MKKLFLLVTLVLILVVLLGADIRRKKEGSLAPVVEKKTCYGYTIIEFGKGINCDGDTVKLVKVDGGQALAKKLKWNSVGRSWRRMCSG